MRKIIFGTILYLSLGFLAPALALAATLSLSPSTGTFNKGCNFSTDIVLDTASAQTDGTDAILFYDNSRLSANTISQGTIYSDYPGSNIDDTNGKITISGLAAFGHPFVGKGTLATVNWTVKDTAQAGATQVKFDFDSNDKTKTTDSNVVEDGTTNEILASVTNGSYTIGTGSCASSGSKAQGAPGEPGSLATPSSSLQPLPTKAPPPATLPNGGTVELTFTVAILGSILTVLGILGLVLF